MQRNQLDDLPLLSRKMRQQSLRAVDLLSYCSTQHRLFGPLLNAYVQWLPEPAETTAEFADHLFQKQIDLGALQGLPISVKDLYGVLGCPINAGTPKSLPAKWQQEGDLVRTIRQHAGIISGKTQTVEFAYGGLGVNHHFGTPRNPWDAQQHRVPGGSSSGAGISVLEGSAVLALGSDTAGSVRIPASFTGVFGLKTSHGRWSTKGVVPLSPTLDTTGLLAASAANLAYGFAAFDSSWISPEPLFEYLGRLPETIRIGVDDPVLWQDVDASIVEVTEAFIARLPRRYKKKTASITGVTEAIELLKLGSVASAELAEFLQSELEPWMHTLDPIIQARINDGGKISAAQWLQRQRRIRALRKSVIPSFDTIDVMLSPTIAIPPPTLEAVGDKENYISQNFQCLRNTCVANMLDLAALTMPTGLDSRGLPVGLQILAPAGNEELLLAVALELEQFLGTPGDRLGRPPMLAGTNV